MKEVVWQVLDKDQIIDLIIKYNAGVEITPDMARRIKYKLEAMEPAELWRHIAITYHNVLMGPDPAYQVDAREEKRRELAYDRAQREKREAPKHVHVQIPTVQRPFKSSTVDEAETVLYGKNYVKRVIRAGDQLVVICHNEIGKQKMERYARKNYPSVYVDCIVYTGGDE